MNTYTQEQWLAEIAHQPPLPTEVPVWLQHFVRNVRRGTIHDLINDRARRVPEKNKEGKAPRYSAVLVLISGDSLYIPTDDAPFPEDATLLLTHRAPSMRTHSGQVAFPGGRREDQDNSPIHTAMREAQEETGLDPDGVQPLALLDPIYIDRTNFAVIPVLAYWEKPMKVYPASPENDWVAPVPIANLVDPKYRYRVAFMQWEGPAFNVQGMVLWGFTGTVVTALLQCAGWEKPWDKGKEPVELFDALKRSQNKEALGDLASGFTAAGPEGGAP
ncbi:NUDIX hydrolase [Corynebacterium anserum]|uniref:NUDIX domain-containing protein n=1 Tax=Corynebacterium anserum TaxID=2684406 RepID=A0A7G7YQD9_9CORY|nr:CoA pyrophosphatase [Corynebacterium anserum]MBC2682395.1 NUDIX domain-containing protein [Corynebacterium anserum]QNH96709.1 NUDIX domain-containing protein [Corynebacterium anserum]